MGRRKKSSKNQKIVASIFGVILLAIITLLGINQDTLNSFTKIEEETSNNITAESMATSTSSEVTGNLTVDFIDVGQADSILITNNNESMLIDAGNNEDGEDIVKYLENKGIKKLNYVVGTHPHEDHIGGLDDVINSDIQIENILMPKITTTTKTFEDVLDAIENKELTVEAPSKGYEFKIGEANCKVMTDSIIDKDNLNISSIVIRLTFGNNSFLFMGDSEEENEKTISWPKADVLKVGHHGSNTSSSEKFLNEVSPKYAVIMAGEGNSYGLPKDEIVKRIESLGTTIYRTDKNGTIEMISDGNEIKITTEK